MKNKKFAFFDLDHTLIPVDSCGLWAYFLITKCGKDEEEFTRIQKQFDEDYFEGVLNMTDFMNFEMGLLHRFPRKELDAYREEYLERFIKPHITKHARDLVESYRKNGYKVALVTATHRYAVEPIAGLFDMDFLIASEPELDVNGEFTGGWISHSFGPQKSEAVKAFMKKNGLSEEDLKECVFYSDSINDLPLLQLVSSHGGKAYAANPDPYLEPIAKENGWPIVRLFDDIVKPMPVAEGKNA